MRTTTMTTMDAPADDGDPEHLSTGWEPQVPVEDSLLRQYLFHNADLTSAIARAAGGEVLDSEDLVAADLRRPSGYWNAVTLLQPPTDLEATVDELRSFHAGGTGQVVLWSAWPTPDLSRLGWRLSGHPPLLVRPPFPAPPASADRDERISRVETAQALAEWEQVAVRGYPFVELDGQPPGGVAPSGLLDDERFGFWWGAEDGVPASIAMGFRSRGLGSLALGVTLAEHRHSGIWRSLCAERLRWIGSDWAAGVFSDFSRRGAERQGFVPVTRFTLWILDRP